MDWIRIPLARAQLDTPVIGVPWQRVGAESVTA